MKIPRKGTEKIRQSLLIAASEVFAHKGYRDATVAEICEQAGANVAAINYHFGDKETLYRESWRRAFHESLKAYPPNGGASDDAPPEERLRAHVTAIVRRMADKNNKEFWFVQREFANPTGLLEEVMREEIHPLQKRTEDLVRELLGPLISDSEVQFCETSIISQCINPMVVRRKLKGKDGEKGGPPQINDIEAYANHVVKFSLAGIQAIRKSAEGKKPEIRNVMKGQRDKSRGDK
jgi:TetR/AcrR family transcriptional regulator, regulator of cefoperazone and chloramphenicol sensitivity